jgi:hypothetical protein
MPSIAIAIALPIVRIAAVGDAPVVPNPQFMAPNAGRWERIDLTPQNGVIDEVARVSFFGVAS